jgi:hypothetical protein
MNEDNIIKFKKGKSLEDVVNSISLDAPEDPENHHRILEVLDKIQENVRNDESVQAMVTFTFSKKGISENWIAGDISVSLLHTTLASFNHGLLKMFSDSNEEL